MYVCVCACLSQICTMFICSRSRRRMDRCGRIFMYHQLRCNPLLLMRKDCATLRPHDEAQVAAINLLWSRDIILTSSRVFSRCLKLI